jgi:ACS family sodium-dependent inorganic phosphate cotransporter
LKLIWHVNYLYAGWLAAKYGGKQLLGISVFGSAILTILTPPLCQISVYLIIAVRVMEGLLQGFLYPSVHALWANWAPPLEKTKLSTIAFSG